LYNVPIGLGTLLLDEQEIKKIKIIKNNNFIIRSKWESGVVVFPLASFCISS
tara:strand:- start:1793 stop:1948 length:156 start_codon:yes stop_codon:yes gene_type:complete